MIWMINIIVFPSTDDLKQHHSKTVNVYFNWQLPSHCILWSHITAAFKLKMLMNNPKQKDWRSSFRNKLRESIVSLNQKELKEQKLRYHYDAYNVPATLVWMWVLSSGKSVAKPKSASFEFNLWSSKILFALLSLWIIRNCESSLR